MTARRRGRLHVPARVPSPSFPASVPAGGLPPWRGARRFDTHAALVHVTCCLPCMAPSLSCLSLNCNVDVGGPPAGKPSRPSIAPPGMQATTTFPSILPCLGQGTDGGLQHCDPPLPGPRNRRWVSNTAQTARIHQHHTNNITPPPGSRSMSLGPSPLPLCACLHGQHLLPASCWIGGCRRPHLSLAYMGSSSSSSSSPQSSPRLPPPASSRRCAASMPSSALGPPSSTMPPRRRCSACHAASPPPPGPGSGGPPGCC